MKQKLTIIGAVFFFNLGAAAAVPSEQVYQFNQDGGRVEFEAIGRPSLLKIRGKGTGPQGSITVKDGKTVGVLSFDMTSLDTGIEVRTRHMKERYLHVDKNPKAVLKLESASQGQFSGELELHGVKKPVQGTYTVSSEKDGAVALQAEFKLKISDFAIEVPTYAGITISDTTTVQVNVDRATVSAAGAVK